MFLTPEILTLFIADTLILLLVSIGFLVSIQILLKFDYTQDTPAQYALEKRAVLVSALVRSALFFKIALFFFFLYTLDAVSGYIPGAMCAAGVVSADPTGITLMVLKSLGLYLFSLWIVADKEDLKSKNYRYTKLKSALFIAVFITITAEYAYEYLFFSSLEPSKVVSCCGAIFDPLKNSGFYSALLSISPWIAAAIFYAIFISMAISVLARFYGLYALLNLIFLPVAVLTLILFFSPYIYELPTHRCLFCFLQKEYAYAGYFIYMFLFLGTFFGFSYGFKKLLLKIEDRGDIKFSMLFNALLVIILTAYPLVYYVKNGVWL